MTPLDRIKQANGQVSLLKQDFDPGIANLAGGEEEARERGGAAASCYEVSKYGRNDGMEGAAVSYHEVPEIGRNGG